jgi:hypothetical protein
MKRIDMSRAIVLIMVTGALVVGCGDQNDDQSAEIRDAIETVVSSSDPANCTKLQTLRFTMQVEFEPSKAAVRMCQRTTKQGSKASATVSDINVSGNRATAGAAIAGSSGFDGQTLQIALVKLGKQWKLDHVDAFVDFDRDAYLSALKRELSEPPTRLPA